MTEEERRKLIAAAYKSKSGRASEEEIAFCVAMYDKYPDEYGEVYKAGAAMAVKDANPWGG